MENNIKVKIIDETEKAVKVVNEKWKRMREDIECLSYSERREFREMFSECWLPKSQIKIEDGYVVYAPKWLINKYEFKEIVNITPETKIIYFTSSK